jgi:PAS domain S-box-containing protein
MWHDGMSMTQAPGPAARTAPLDTSVTDGQLHDHIRLSLLNADVGVILTQATTLREMLQACAQAVVDRLDAAFARIWTLNHADQVLELQASAGMYTHLDGPHGRVPVGKFKIGLIAREREPHLTNHVVGDPRVGDQEWARREGMVAFAGYPLIIGEELVGVLAMFARHTLTDADFKGLGSVAHGLAIGIGRMRNIEALREKEERLRAALDASATGTFRWDVASSALDWDDNLDRLFGLAPGETARHLDQFTTLVHPDDRPAVFAALERCITVGADFDLEFRVVWPDGQVRWLLDRGRMIRDGNGRPIYMTGACVDITSARQREEELARIAAALERSNRDLDQFAYIASHDLKAPLRGIANLSQWIEEDLGDDASDTVKSHLQLLRGRVHRMEALIDGILQYSRAGRARSESETVAVGRLVCDVIELIAPPDRVRFDVAPDLPVLVTERLLLQQVFQNLIANAVKYNPRPDATVRVAGTATADGWRFSVSDNGPGIAPEFHERIWGVFQTLAPRDKVEGTGIGLALVKKIVESRGGSVRVDSAPGQGATFEFTWPAAAASE